MTSRNKKYDYKIFRTHAAVFLCLKNHRQGNNIDIYRYMTYT